MPRVISIESIIAVITALAGAGVFKWWNDRRRLKVEGRRVELDHGMDVMKFNLEQMTAFNLWCKEWVDREAARIQSYYQSLLEERDKEIARLTREIARLSREIARLIGGGDQDPQQK